MSHEPNRQFSDERMIEETTPSSHDCLVTIESHQVAVGREFCRPKPSASKHKRIISIAGDCGVTSWYTSLTTIPLPLPFASLAAPLLPLEPSFHEPRGSGVGLRQTSEPNAIAKLSTELDKFSDPFNLHYFVGEFNSEIEQLQSRTSLKLILIPDPRDPQKFTRCAENDGAILQNVDNYGWINRESHNEVVDSLRTMTHESIPALITELWRPNISITLREPSLNIPTRSKLFSESVGSLNSNSVNKEEKEEDKKNSIGNGTSGTTGCANRAWPSSRPRTTTTTITTTTKTKTWKKVSSRDR
ncbi:hypothetical protein WN51_00648 [Melipona quadrifasciata]|uniref:Uncharacterized protein n=1 Tax=Melipona quadrifasciata TaxID=166423 RepID=A0A0N0BG60_9HYME|nr:hypothetical protein WN51_00648 [Melipona quadrifasciata]